MFSGGKDSTAAAAYYLQKGYAVELVTFDNGAETGLEKSRRKAEMIMKKYPDRCVWKMMSSTRLFRDIAIKGMEKDIKKFGNLVCCGCKLAMLCEAVIYCRKNGIESMADGFEREQDYYPEQTPDYMEIADSLAEEFGVTCFHPLYDMNAGEIEELTLNSGIPAEPIQAECLFGENRVSNKNILKYMQSKLPSARAYLEKNTG